MKEQQASQLTPGTRFTLLSQWHPGRLAVGIPWVLPLIITLCTSSLLQVACRSENFKLPVNIFVCPSMKSHGSFDHVLIYSFLY